MIAASTVPLNATLGLLRVPTTTYAFKSNTRLRVLDAHISTDDEILRPPLWRR